MINYQIRNLVEAQGWTDYTLLTLISDWLESSGNLNACIKHLQETADAENETEDDETRDCPLCGSFYYESEGGCICTEE